MIKFVAHYIGNGPDRVGLLELDAIQGSWRAAAVSFYPARIELGVNLEALARLLFLHSADVAFPKRGPYPEFRL